MFFSPVRPYVRLAPACVCSRTCASVRVNPIIRPRPSSYTLVRACTSASAHSCVFVCIHIIKSPDASACIISDASGCVFRSRTFKTHYTSIYIVTITLSQFDNPMCWKKNSAAAYTTFDLQFNGHTVVPLLRDHHKIQ